MIVLCKDTVHYPKAGPHRAISGNATMLPACGGKDGILYLLIRDLLGGFGDGAAGDCSAADASRRHGCANPVINAGYSEHPSRGRRECMLTEAIQGRVASSTSMAGERWLSAA
jgi:hypothetical protein